MVDHARVLLRTVCGERVGLGHYRRCLTLAEALRERGADVTLLVAADERSQDLLSQTDVSTRRLAIDVVEPAATLAVAEELAAQILVIDDYAFSSEAIHACASARLRIGVLDDVGDRQLEVDLILNGAPGAEVLPYDAPTLLLGTQYVLLRSAFRDVPMRAAVDTVRRAFVMMGGSDPQALTASVVAAVRAALPKVDIDVIIGPLGQLFETSDPRVALHLAPPELPAIMQRADLAVSAAGQSLYELAASGVPTLAVAVADNQRPQLEALAEAGLVVIGKREMLADQVAELANDRALRAVMIERGKLFIDGRGSVRAADAIIATTRNAAKGRGEHG